MDRDGGFCDFIDIETRLGQTSSNIVLAPQHTCISKKEKKHPNYFVTARHRTKIPLTPSFKIAFA
jgi:hypothetical protein